MKKDNSLFLVNEQFSRTHAHVQAEMCLSQQKMGTFPLFPPRQRPAGQWDSQLSWRCGNLLQHTGLIQTPLPVFFLSSQTLSPSCCCAYTLCDCLGALTSLPQPLLQRTCAQPKPVVKINRWLAIKRARWACFSFSSCHCEENCWVNPTVLWGAVPALFIWITNVIYYFFQTQRQQIDGVWLGATARDGKNSDAFTCTMKAWFNVNQMPTQALLLTKYLTEKSICEARLLSSQPPSACIRKDRQRVKRRGGEDTFSLLMTPQD